MALDGWNAASRVDLEAFVRSACAEARRTNVASLSFACRLLDSHQIFLCFLLINSTADNSIHTFHDSFFFMMQLTVSRLLFL